MSLVLNTNDNWQLKESYWFIWYPDINQILLKPIAWKYRLWVFIPEEAWEVWNSSKVWANINWTIINYLCNKLVSPYMFIGSPENWYWCTWIITNTSSNATYRIWIEWWFSWWEIIWKDLRRRSMISNASANHTHQNHVHYAKVRLLHLDWTLTDVWDLWSMTAQAPDFYDDTTFYYNSSNYTTCNVKMLQTITSWVVAQAGDRVVADVYVESSASVIFWHDWANQNNAYTSVNYTPIIKNTWLIPNPIQVSVE